MKFHMHKEMENNLKPKEMEKEEMLRRWTMRK
jgi:hypothetical protein